MRKLPFKDEVIIGFARTVGAAPVLIAVYYLARHLGVVL
jgi:hypothetical protein